MSLYQPCRSSHLEVPPVSTLYLVTLEELFSSAGKGVHPTPLIYVARIRALLDPFPFHVCTYPIFSEQQLVTVTMVFDGKTLDHKAAEQFSDVEIIPGTEVMKDLGDVQHLHAGGAGSV